MSKLSNLMQMQQHRRIGNTTFMLRGMNFGRKGVFIFADQNHARKAIEDMIRTENLDVEWVNRAEMSVGKMLFRSIEILRDDQYVKYYGLPVLVDHFAMQLLIQEEQKRLLKMVEEARNEKV